MKKYDLIVVGGGPAGMSAALYACEHGKNVLLLEAEALGGQMLLSQNIKNYPGVSSVKGSDLAKQMEKQLLEFGCEILLERVRSIHRTPGGDFRLEGVLNEWLAREVVYAAGAKPKRLYVPGEDRFLGKGVSYCAVCDGIFFQGKEVAVIGGGNSALEEALQISNFAKSVYLICKEQNFVGSERLCRAAANKENVYPMMNYILKEIDGTDRVTSVKLEHQQSKKIHILPVSGVLIAIGRRPVSELASSILTPNSEGFLEADENGQTKVRGFYAVGDCRKKCVRQIVNAAADGANAALFSIQKSYLKEEK